MKTPVITLGLSLFFAMPVAYGNSPGERTFGPCYHVRIQNDRHNSSSVRQACDMNFSRTVQAGQHNQAATVQSGHINNKVRQYQFNSSRNLGNR